MVTSLVTLRNPRGLDFTVLAIVLDYRNSNVKFIENSEVSGSEKSQNVVIQEVRVNVQIPIPFQNIIRINIV